MKLGNIFRGPKWPRDAAEFIATHFADKSVTEFFDEPRFERFLYLAKTETWVEAAREYRDVTGEDIQSLLPPRWPAGCSGKRERGGEIRQSSLKSAAGGGCTCGGLGFG